MSPDPQSRPMATLDCPAWCTVSSAEHAHDLAAKDSATFHRGSSVDTWRLDYDARDNEISVYPEVYASSGHADETLIIVLGDIGRGSEDMAELTVSDARRLAAAILRCCDLADATR